MTREADENVVKKKLFFRIFWIMAAANAMKKALFIIIYYFGESVVMVSLFL
jgi:hypothetical protein